MELLNTTPFVADTMETLDAQGQAVLLVLVKGSWLLDNQLPAPPAQAAPLLKQAKRCRLGDLVQDTPQLRLLQAAQKADEWVDWVAGDYVLPKPALDVLVAGYCHSSEGRAQRLFEAGLWIGEQEWRIHAHAPRIWRPASLLGWRIEPLEAVCTVPMHAAFSFGGQMNPERGPQSVLAGRLPPEQRVRLSLLPWLEDPRGRIRSPTDRLRPAGWNLWPSDAPHRQCHAGTCDDSWRRLRAPRPPLDFNPRFYNLAAPDLQLSRVPAAGTRVLMMNLSARGRDEFLWPGLGIRLQAQREGGPRPTAVDLVPDTLLIEPTLRRYSITWRAALRLGEGAGRVSHVQLSAGHASAGLPLPGTAT